MPRLPRMYIEGALYYVTSQGNQNRNLFNDQRDYESYLELLAKYKKDKGFKLFAFVLLPKHLHLVIELKSNVTISSIMHDLNSLYTKVFNSRYERKGHLFQGRFKSILVEKEPYLTKLIRYVHLNPKRADMVGQPQDYSFSSHKLYVVDQATKEAARELRFPDINVEIQEVFSFFKQPDKQKAYEEYMDSATDKDNFEMARLLHRRAFVGSDEFVENIKKKMQDSLKEEEQASVKKTSYKLIIGIGTIAIVVLGVITFYLYASNLETRNRFNLFIYELSQNMVFTPSEVKKEISADLKNSQWEIRLVSSSGGESSIDILDFKGGEVLSSSLSAQGYPASNYSVTAKDDGSMVWETIQTKDDGSTATWYGVWSGDKMKGILSKRTAEGESLDYSFTSIKRR